MKYRIDIKESNRLEQQANSLLRVKPKNKVKKIKRAKPFKKKFVMPKEVKEFYRDFYRGLRDL